MVAAGGMCAGGDECGDIRVLIRDYAGEGCVFGRQGTVAVVVVVRADASEGCSKNRKHICRCLPPQISHNIYFGFCRSI